MFCLDAIVKTPNARHHPPRGPAKEFDKLRVRGRVHAVVGRGVGEQREQIHPESRSEPMTQAAPKFEYRTADTPRQIHNENSEG
jgi:hypothetical protein